MTARQRIRPLHSADWSPEVRELLGATHASVAELEGERRTDGHKTLNILRTVAHLPRLLGPFLGFSAALAQQGELSRRDSELLALRAAWNSRSDFEWGHHVLYARAAGIDENEIENVGRGPARPEWSERDRNLLLAADQLHARQQIDDAVWDGLAAHWSEAQRVEIAFVVGQYTMLSMVANSTGVELEPGLASLPNLEALEETT